MTVGDLTAVEPAIILAVGAGILAVPVRVGATARAWLGAAVAVGAAIAAVAIGPASTPASEGAVARDPASVFLVALIGVTAAAMLALATAQPRRSRDETSLLLFSACGAAIVVSAADLVLLFAALVLLTLPVYAQTGGDGREPARHLVLGATSSAIAVYGFALLYAATGETGYAAVGRATHNPLYLAGISLALIGVGAHALLAPARRSSVVVTVAIAGALLRLIGVTRSGEAALDQQVSLATFAAIALAVAATAALRESRVRWLVGYATLAQIGYVAVAAAASAAPAAVVALAAYAASAIALFAMLAAVRGDEPVLADLAGLGRSRPLLVLALGIALLSLVGVPPTIGFVAKVYVFEAAIRAQLLWLVVLGALASVAGAAAYARVAFACLAAAPLDAVSHPSARVATTVAVLAALAVLIGGIFPGPLLDAAQTVRF